MSGSLSVPTHLPHESAHSRDFRPPQANPLMQSLRRPITRTVPELIPYLGSSPTTHRILGLEWYECRTPTTQNFVILEVGRAEYNNLWLRMDRTVGPAGLLGVSRNTDRVSVHYLVPKLCISLPYFIGPAL
ncbi:hypothetical protein BS47DRAFT_368067 [Hydnum rufescens UP504]|uniref:Uncharacterized protein n=1 Tax=Hydnum rufescens UP504 TaxID=1448309 RepID=A0A9P6ALB4_9AGAM|nr:hypothetical protein BS47DRAFT_368067 [Hydnum rufescens UP504]